MTPESATSVVKEALASIQSFDLAQQQKCFDPDSSFFLGQNAYRIDSLSSFQAASKAFFDAGGRIVHMDIRQPRVVQLQDGALVSFHFAQRQEIGQASVGTTGRGTALVVNGVVVHLHLGDNVGVSALPTQNSSVDAVFAAVDRIGTRSANILGGALWGTE